VWPKGEFLSCEDGIFVSELFLSVEAARCLELDILQTDFIVKSVAKLFKLLENSVLDDFTWGYA